MAVPHVHLSEVAKENIALSVHTTNKNRMTVQATEEMPHHDTVTVRNVHSQRNVFLAEKETMIKAMLLQGVMMVATMKSVVTHQGQMVDL